MPDVIGAAASMVGGFSQLWAKGPFTPKGQRKTPLDTLVEARRAELARIATTGSIDPPTFIRLADGERLIFFLPIIFNECASTVRRRAVSGVTSRGLIWPFLGGAGKRVFILPVDAGTLFLTNRRFIFKGAKRRRDFPLADLTHVSTCRTGVALATLGRYGIAYFTGLDALIFGIQCTPDTQGSTPRPCVACALTGQDLEVILQLLGTTPTRATT